MSKIPSTWFMDAPNHIYYGLKFRSEIDSMMYRVKISHIALENGRQGPKIRTYRLISLYITLFKKESKRMYCILLLW